MSLGKRLLRNKTNSKWDEWGGSRSLRVETRVVKGGEAWELAHPAWHQISAFILTIDQMKTRHGLCFTLWCSVMNRRFSEAGLRVCLFLPLLSPHRGFQSLRCIHGWALFSSCHHCCHSCSYYSFQTQRFGGESFRKSTLRTNGVHSDILYQGYVFEILKNTFEHYLFVIM